MNSYRAFILAGCSFFIANAPSWADGLPDLTSPDGRRRVPAAELTAAAV